MQCSVKSFLVVHEVLCRYEGDQQFGSVLAALNGTWPEDRKQRRKPEELLAGFPMRGTGLYYMEKLCVPALARKMVLELAHDSKLAGHFAFAKTLARLSELHWKHNSKLVRQYCDGCSVFQHQKDFHGQILNDLAALYVPTRRWGLIAMDFNVKLRMTPHGYHAISTWVDRLSRRVRFIACKDTDQARDVAHAFFTHILPHHGFSDGIISDRDATFTSQFWGKLVKRCGVKLQMSTAKHTQTNRASDVMKRMVENYIRCFCNYEQKDWDVFLPCAQLAYNSAVSGDLGPCPFEVDFG